MRRHYPDPLFRRLPPVIEPPFTFLIPNKRLALVRDSLCQTDVTPKHNLLVDRVSLLPHDLLKLLGLVFVDLLLQICDPSY